MPDKKVNYEIISTDKPTYAVLKLALKWHDELRFAAIALAWRKALKPDIDGHIVLGKCVRVTDLHREFEAYDFIVVLNKEYWEAFSPEQRLALMDHELCHAAARLDAKTSEQQQDEKGRKVWRTCKHDIEEFREVVERHGCYKADLEAFAKALRQKAPLFETATKT